MLEFNVQNIIFCFFFVHKTTAVCHLHAMVFMHNTNSYCIT